MCKGKCQESCGPIDMSKVERKIIEEYCEKNSIPFHEIEHVSFKKVLADYEKTNEELKCPYLNGEGKCSIYSVRPLICRLWGAVKSMPCPENCAVRLLPKARGMELLKLMDQIA